MIMLDEARGRLRRFASLLSVTVLFLAGLAVSATAAGQYPAKPIRVVITYSGGAEAINRLILVPGFESPPFWGALFGPAQLPQPIVARLQGELAKALQIPEVRTRMEGAGLMPVSGTPDELAALLKRNVQSLAKITRAAGIRPE